MQEDNERLRDWATESIVASRRARAESIFDYNRLRGEVDRLNEVNANMQSQLAVLETRFNHLVRRDGTYAEA